MMEVRCNMTFLIIWCHWYTDQQHVMQTALLVAPLYLLGHDDKNEVQHDFFGYVTPLAPAPALHDAEGIVISSIIFLMSWGSRWGAKGILAM